MITQPPTLRRNGRIQGTYVYLVLCEEGASIFVKIGISDQPIKRLRELATGCPLVPGVLAYVELPSRPLALLAERGLHSQFTQWRSRGEWFRFRKRDREKFNAGLNTVLSKWKGPSWPMKWTKLNAIELLQQINHTAQLKQAADLKRKLQKNRAKIEARPDIYGIET
jgi:hypothetical protein